MRRDVHALRHEAGPTRGDEQEREPAEDEQRHGNDDGLPGLSWSATFAMPFGWLASGVGSWSGRRPYRRVPPAPVPPAPEVPSPPLPFPVDGGVISVAGPTLCPAFALARLRALQRAQDVVAALEYVRDVGRQVVDRLRGSSGRVVLSIRPSYQSFRSAFQHGVAAAAGRAASGEQRHGEQRAPRNALARDVTWLERGAADNGYAGCCGGTLRLRCKAFVSAGARRRADGSFARDAGDQGTAPRRVAPPRRSALFFGGGPADRGASLARGRRPGHDRRRCSHCCGIPGGLARARPARALAVWSASRSRGRSLPDRTWDYANRALVYLLFAPLGLWLAERTRELALGLWRSSARCSSGRSSARCCRSSTTTARRRRTPARPGRLWNQLALLGDFALPLALWRRRLAGTLLAYAAIVALALTYSRGGLLRRVVVLVAWFALDDERLEPPATLVAAALPAAVVVGIAFALPGVTSDGQSSHARWRDGLVFGALLVAGAVATALLRRGSGCRACRSGLVVVRRGRRRRRARGRLIVNGRRLGGDRQRGRPPRRHELELPVRWWRQAWTAGSRHRLAGTGAGSFALTNLRYRTTNLDQTIEPHNLPLQFLTETGVVGLLLFVLAAAALLRPVLAPAAGPSSRSRCAARVPRARARRRRLGLRRRLRARVPRRGRARRPAVRAPRLALRAARRDGCRAARLVAAAAALARRPLGERRTRRLTAGARGAARQPGALASTRSSSSRSGRRRSRQTR